MSTSLEQIFTAVDDLSALIEKYKATEQYRSTTEKISQDGDALKLIGDLVAKGAEISKSMESGTYNNQTLQAERTLLQERLDASPLVKEHLTAQKEYLHLLQEVLVRLKDPEKF